MATLPVYQQRTSVDTTGGQHPRAGTPGSIGAALEGFGANVQRFAGQLQGNNEQNNAAAAKLNELLQHQRHEDAVAWSAKAISDQHVQWSQYLEDAKVNAKPGAPNFTGNLLDTYDVGMGKALESAPDEMSRAYFEQRSQALRTNLAEQAIHFETGARIKWRSDQFDSAIDNVENVAARDPAQGKVALGEARAALQASGNEAFIATKLPILQERASVAAVVGMGERDPKGTRALLAKYLGVTPGAPHQLDRSAGAGKASGDAFVDGLPWKNAVQLYNSIDAKIDRADAYAQAQRDRAEARAEAAANKRERLASHAFNTLSSFWLAGQIDDPSSASNRKLWKDMEGTDYLDSAKQLQAQVPARAALAQLPLDAQQGQLDDFHARANQSGMTPQLADEIKRRQTVVDAARREYGNAPLTAATKYGVLPQKAPLNTSSVDSIVAGLPARAEQAATVEQRVTRAPVSPLEPAEADALQTKLAGMDYVSRAAAVERIASAMSPGQAKALAASIDPKDRALSLAFEVAGGRAPNGRALGELVMKGADAIKNKTVAKDDKTVIGWQATLARELGDSLPNDALRSSVLEAAKYIAAAGAADKHSGMASDNDLRMALRAALGGRVEDFNDIRTVLPSGMDEAALRKRLTQVTVADIAAQSTPAGQPGEVVDLSRSTVLAAGHQVPVAEFVKSLPNARLVYAGPGQYNVLAGATGDSKGRPVLDSTGRRRIVVRVQ